MVYLDTSVMLSRYFGEPMSEVAEGIWNGEGEFVASALMVAETVVALRRSRTTDSTRRAREWLDSALARADADFLLVSVSYDLTGAVDVLRRDDRLSACRTSDGLHIATAMWFQRESARTVSFASLDHRQREIASRCGLPLLPA